jgi:hypothetical protein
VAEICFGESFQMIWLLSSVAVFLLTCLFIFKLLRGSLSNPKDVTDLVAQLRPVNPKALAQLTSKADDVLLKKSLPPEQYRRLRRQKLLTLRAYCRAALRNSDILQSYGQALQREPDPETRDFGRQLASSALHLRPQLLYAIALAQLGSWVPGLDVDAAAVSRVYAVTSDRLRSSLASKPAIVRQLLERSFPVS